MKKDGTRPDRVNRRSAPLEVLLLLLLPMSPPTPLPLPPSTILFEDVLDVTEPPPPSFTAFMYASADEWDDDDDDDDDDDATAEAPICCSPLLLLRMEASLFGCNPLLWSLLVCCFWLLSCCMMRTPLSCSSASRDRKCCTHRSRHTSIAQWPLI